MSDREREISASIRALKTLRFENGRVSIDPQEVLDQPGYIEQRAAAAALVGQMNYKGADTKLPWRSVVHLESGYLSEVIARHLVASHRQGMTLAQALTGLHSLLVDEPERVSP